MPTVRKNGARTRRTVHRNGTTQAAQDDRKTWRDAVGYFKRVRRRLLRSPLFAHRVIAISAGQIWEVGDDKFDLADKLRRKYPGKWFLVVRVEAKDEEVDVPAGVGR